MTKFPRPEQITNCLACTLADAMKDCPACQFAPRIQRATDADIFHIWQEIWGRRTPDEVAWFSWQTGGEMYDKTQLSDEEIAEMEN